MAGGMVPLDSNQMVPRTLVKFDAEHLSTLVTAADRAPPDSVACLRRLKQLSNNRQLTITRVELILRQCESTGHRCELLVKDTENGVSKNVQSSVKFHFE